MSLDLNELIGDWCCPHGELAARVVSAADGRQFVQLRIDLGLLQMFPDGRPDGKRYRGMPSVRDYIEHELRLGHVPDEQDWSELQRELVQLNYRRLAWGQLAEAAARRADLPAERGYLRRVARDIDECLALIRAGAGHGGGDGAQAALWPALYFHRARYLSRLALLEGQIDEAIEQAELGAEALDSALAALGLGPEQREEDPGAAYLRRLGQRLRRQHGVRQTLQERLAAALEREDFETAARLRERLRRRRSRPPAPEPGGQ